MPETLRARLDPRRVDVILANLIGNALRHGGGTSRVRVWARADAVPRDAAAPAVTARERGTIEILVRPGWGPRRAAERQLACTAAVASAAKDSAQLDDIQVTVRRTGDDEAAAQICAR